MSAMVLIQCMDCTVPKDKQLTIYYKKKNMYDFDTCFI